MGGLGGAGGGFGFGERGLRFGQRDGERREIRLAAAAGREAGFDIGQLGFEPGDALLVIAQRGLQLIAARGEIGKLAGQRGKRLLRHRQRQCRRRHALVDAAQLRGVGLRVGAQHFFFAREPHQGRRGIGGERAFAREIGGVLAEPAVEFGDALLGAGFFAFERVARHQEALQRGGGTGLGLAQGRQAGGDGSLADRGFGLLGGAVGDDADGEIPGLLGGADLDPRRDPAQME